MLGKAKFKVFQPYLILFILAIIGYWQISFLQYPLKWDIIDQAWPWKFFIGESLQNYHLPLWNPYQHMGYPIHADPQSSAWYPIVWFFGYFWGYSIYIVSIDLVLHFFLAGCGMYLLGKKLDLKPKVALLMGMAYMFSGFFVGNAQHFMWIISATWLPFIIGAYIDIFKYRKLKHAVIFSLYMLMIITGGYPAFTMILFYFLITLFIYYSYIIIRDEEKGKFAQFLRTNLIALGLSLLNSIVMVFSIIKLIPSMSRTSGVNLSDALYGSLTPKSIISLLLPFGSVNQDMSSVGTDLSMANVYFGLLMMIFLVFSFMLKKPPIIKIFLYFGIVLFAAAMGKYLPVREFFYHYVPFFKIFRFPSLLRVFVIISFIVVGGFALNKYFSDQLKYRKHLKITFLITFVMLVVMTSPRIYGEYLNMGELVSSGGLFSFSDQSTIPQQILFQGTIQLIFLGLFAIAFLKSGKKTKLILLISATGLMFAAQLNAPYTVYNEKIPSKDIHEMTHKLPAGFPLPTLNPVEKHSDRNSYSFGSSWKNLNIFWKQIAWDGYNPLHLKHYEYLEDSIPNLLQAVIKNPALYLASNIEPMDSIEELKFKTDFNPGTVYVSHADFEEIKECRPDTNASITYSGFSPLRSIIKVNTKNKSLLCYLQNHYYGWRAKVNNKKTEIHHINHSFMGVALEKGENIIEFEYRPSLIIIGFYISLISTFLSIIYLLLVRIRILKND
jgi:hypothetical protein